MTSDHPPPTRKRSHPSDLQQQLERDEIIQQNAAPVLGVAPVKRRRSSASSAEEHSSSIVEEKEQQSAFGEKEVNLDGAPEGKLFLVTVKTRKELLESKEVAAESLKLDQLLQLKQQSANTKNAATDDDVDVAWGQELEALDSLRRFAKYHQDEARRQLDNEVLKTLVLPAASSLRSAMARNALLCVQDLILELKAETANHLDIIVPVLLNRACSEKQFLRDLAREIVSVAGLYVTKCIIRMDRQRLRKFLLEARGSFFDEMAAFLNCKAVECKAATRRTCHYSRRVIGNEEFVALVKESLSGSAQLDVVKASEIRQAAKSGHAKSSL
ncbi:hypothetical protein PInf_005027 [Phytophthora infestans]|nr:hypothetical protein PInf_005027 [Phytophthora infestans]